MLGTTSRTRNQNEGLNTVRTYSPKAGEIERAWYVIDATDVVLGRLATHAAALLRGKHKPTFAPHLDGGDFVIIINADQVALTSNKRRSEEHTSELQSRGQLVCRLLLENKKTQKTRA